MEPGSAITCGLLLILRMGSGTLPQQDAGGHRDRKATGARHCYIISYYTMFLLTKHHVFLQFITGEVDTAQSCNKLRKKA